MKTQDTKADSHKRESRRRESMKQIKEADAMIMFLFVFLGDVGLFSDTVFIFEFIRELFIDSLQWFDDQILFN